MAASPRYKVYSVEGKYLASFKYASDAASLVGCRGTLGTTIRDGHSTVVWEDGKDGEAGDSYDRVADVIHSRISSRPQAQ